MTDSIISVRGLSKTYGGKRFGIFPKAGFRALAGVDIQVGRGSVFGLLGPNGAGKTTLIKILLGLVRGAQGEAALFGYKAGDPRARRRVGYLPEAHRMPPYLTGRQVLTLYGMMSGRSRSWLASRVPRWIERVGMTESADRKVREYSKGMQQRIGLAQALVHEPELIFLDEPTDGVDPVGRKVIREIVAELKQSDATVFINSHLLMEVEMICDRVVIMDKGKIIQDGTVEALTTQTGSVRFDCRPVPAEHELARVLQGLGGAPRVDAKGFDVALGDGETDQVIDRLRAAGVSIRAVVPKKLTLEDSFIALVQKGVK
jgi:ABC-2 type transport system ATP-binding protein